MKKYFITGGAGFIGSNFINILFARLISIGESFEIHCLDKLTYAGDIDFIDLEVRESGRFFFYKIDIVSKDIFGLFHEHKFYCGVHFAAESHVDRSIAGPMVFMETNVVGTANLLEAWRLTQDSRFVVIGTDEVYGSIDIGLADERTLLNPSSPYSASKTGADLISLAYGKTYNMDVVVTRCTNNYGPNQNIEKFIPKMIRSIKNNQELLVYGDGKNSREWIHVSDHVEALLLIIDSVKLSHSIYNIGSGMELSNLEVISTIRGFALGTTSKIQFIQDRLGHDFRYALDSSRIRAELEWSPKIDFIDGLEALYNLMA